jgi:hypothetical protein
MDGFESFRSDDFSAWSARCTSAALNGVERLLKLQMQAAESAIKLAGGNFERWLDVRDIDDANDLLQQWPAQWQQGLDAGRDFALRWYECCADTALDCGLAGSEPIARLAGIGDGGSDRPAPKAARRAPRGNAE